MKKTGAGQIANAGGGFFVIAIGLFFFLNSGGDKLSLGTFRNIGPGMFPYIISIITMMIGAVIVLIDFFRTNKTARFDFRGVITVIAAFSLFALFFEKGGILLTTAGSVFVIASAQPKIRFLETVIVGVALSVFVWLVFSFGLGMPLYFSPEVLR